MVSPTYGQEVRKTTSTGHRVVEDGGTGEYKAVMYTDATLPSHTIFRPENLEPFGEQNKLSVIA